MKKLCSTEAELKKNGAYKKHVFTILDNTQQSDSFGVSAIVKRCNIGCNFNIWFHIRNRKQSQFNIAY